jgi:hypothetical protein
LGSEHSRETKPQAGGCHKERHSRRKGGDAPLGYSGRRALRREQCDMLPKSLEVGILKAGILEAALFTRQRTSVYPTTQLGGSISVATELLSVMFTLPSATYLLKRDIKRIQESEIERITDRVDSSQRLRIRDNERSL